ncbi:16S rRNA (uracil(1498)-N(3))-methyltransferase [Aestuariivivens sediminicola]|uniref:16S rRNA (uracil(1498)-N(3))-methyltransferase n=1 Tax=Aestuariivivens sediminicola TaxID=2913560 RepID=UPI001F58FE30|nr:16S rRNA (uracil(1498)-N(3))-methyltransferase [Aestuariivivens sediminicola]
MQLFYHSEINEDTIEFGFNKEESRHITKVLRKQSGDLLHITDGKGWLYTVEVMHPDPRHCVAQVTDRSRQAIRPYRLHMAVAPTKMNERYEWFLEKATEIGVDTITPLVCDHSERKVIKKERYEKILQTALKQSLNCYLPKLNDLTPFNDFISENRDGDLFIAHCETNQKNHIKQHLTRNGNTTILIGPEGDFSVKEIKMALENNYIPVNLGASRLRTETAAIVACHAVAFINE